MASINKVSDITITILADYLHIDNPTSDQLDELGTMLNSAKAYVSSYVGLPLSAPADDAETATDESAVDNLDSHPEFVSAVMVLVQNQYDNRTFYTDKGQVESVINSILNLHSRNLL
jgi:uncharacterized phage protein (predicted DNA packaging)